MRGARVRPRDTLRYAGGTMWLDDARRLPPAPRLSRHAWWLRGGAWVARMGARLVQPLWRHLHDHLAAVGCASGRDGECAARPLHAVLASADADFFCFEPVSHAVDVRSLPGGRRGIGWCSWGGRGGAGARALRGASAMNGAVAVRSQDHTAGVKPLRRAEPGCSCLLQFISILWLTKRTA